MKILIAEDEPAQRQIFASVMKTSGYDVVVAQDGNEAWQALTAADAPQIAILDWMMPGIDGPELCRRIRGEHGRRPYTYIILLTAMQKEENLVIGMEAGADDYVPKPVKMSELKARVNAGVRMIQLQNELLLAQETLADRVADLEVAYRDLESFSHTVANNLLKSLLAIGEDAKSIQDAYGCRENEQCIMFTRRIYEKIKTLGQLIGTMQDYFRPMKGELHRQTFDLGRIAAEIVGELKKLAPERLGSFQIPEGLPVTGDKRLLREALEELLRNAWEHTRQRPDPVIELGETDVDGEQVLFVRDNGQGFNMTYASKLFKPFQRLPGRDETSSRGIGLATVERIVRRHGGRVWAKGEPDQGATFYFTLPKGKT